MHLRSLINEKYIEDLICLLSDHVSSFSHILSLEEREFIYINIDESFLYSGICYRFIILYNELNISKELGRNCFWSMSLEGVSFFINKMELDYKAGHLYSANVCGINLNQLILYLNHEYNADIRKDFLGEEEILSLDIREWIYEDGFDGRNIGQNF